MRNPNILDFDQRNERGRGEGLVSDKAQAFQLGDSDLVTLFLTDPELYAGLLQQVYMRQLRNTMGDGLFILLVQQGLQ